MFFPPLDSTVLVDVPSNARAGGVSLLFRARIGSASALEQLRRDRVKVQAWTNAPVDDDRAEGQWGAYNFEEALAMTPVKSDDGVVPFSLPSPAEDNAVEEPFTLFLTLKLRDLPRQRTEADFQLTYRLLYPNGEIKWLGYYRRDLRCVLKKTDPWLAPPVPAGQTTSGSTPRTFTSIAMKEPWGCWAIGRRSVKYYPKGTGTDDESTLLVFVPRRGPSTFALHQPIILHGAGLKLDSSGIVTCRSSTPTRVYTAVMSQPELSFAIPELDLHWFGVKESYAFIASAAPEQPVSINAVPLFVNAAAAAGRSTTVSLDLAEHGLLAEHQRLVVYNPLTNGVLDSDNWGTHQLPLSIGRSGGSCVVSPVYTLSSNKSSHIGKAPWRIAYVTSHTLATEPERDADSVAGTESEASKPDSDSETEFLNQEIKPPPPRPRIVATVNPQRTLEFLVPLIWRTLGYLVRALIMRLFAIVGLPVSPLLSYLRSARPKQDHIKTQVRAIGCGSRAESTVAAEPEHAVPERSEVPGEVVSDSATEVASSTGGERWPSSRVLNVPKGPFSLLAHTNLAINGDENTRSPYPEVELDGERMDLKITPLGHGWAVMQAKEDVHGGRVEIYGTATSTWNGSLP